MQMSKLWSALAVSTFCLLPWFNSTQAHAGTVTLTLEDLGPGNNSGGVYTYPYDFSINGSPTTSPLMCYIFSNQIYVGETWTATVVPITASSPADIQELAYLDSVVSDPNSSAATVSAAQWAAWELFDAGDFPSETGAPDPPGQAAVTAELTNAATFVASVNPDFYDNYDLYIPVAGSQIPSGDGPPQSFVGDPPPAPEPGSLVLVGTGLLLCATLLLRKGRGAQTVRS